MPVCLCRVCKRLTSLFSVDMIIMMVEYLSQLCVVHPHGLFAGAECLTFINKGFSMHYSITIIANRSTGVFPWGC